MFLRVQHTAIMVILLVLAPGGIFAHQDIWLKNEVGDRITPTQNHADPYSPRKTCGGCHSYMTITSGYHFQQGFDEVKDRYDERKPWNLSPGMFGKWLPTAAAGRLAAKANSDPRQMDLSTYDWIGGGGKYSPKHKVKATSCGGCHPGGGPMEFGRNAQGKPERAMNLIQAEALNKIPLDGDFTSHATPDRKSHFRESGVVEADCLICHMPGYGMDRRNEQLGQRNYRWAATAGAGIGAITGSVFSYARPDAGPEDPQFAVGTWNLSRRPVAAYSWSNPRFFTANGRLKGQIIRKNVAVANCLQCHGEGDAKNVGTHHHADHDAHLKAGLVCTDCHGLIGKTAGERLRHQIAKGHSPVLSVRNDLDGQGMKTCVSCHHQNQYRPTRPGMPRQAKNPLATHAARFPKATFHTYLISCMGCHATAQPARAMIVLDTGTGHEFAYTANHLEGVRSAFDYEGILPVPWQPWMIRDNKYAPAVPKWMLWFGEKMPNGEIRPIPLRHVKQAARSIAGLTVIAAGMPDGGKRRRQAVLSDQDISTMIDRLTKTGFKDIVYLADQKYSLKKGKLVAEPLPESTFIHYSIEHGVLPLSRKAAYGAKGRPDGCLDCHSDTAAFFSKMRIHNIRGVLKQDYPELKEPNAMPQYRSWKLRGVPSFE